MIPSNIHLGDTVTRRIEATDRNSRLHPPGGPLLHCRI